MDRRIDEILSRFHSGQDVVVAEYDKLSEALEEVFGIGYNAGYAAFGDEFMSEGEAAKRGISADDVDPDQLDMGIHVEMEHTNNPAIAEKIALDHLAESDQYYTYLEEMEKGFKS